LDFHKNINAGMQKKDAQREISKATGAYITKIKRKKFDLPNSTGNEKMHLLKKSN